MIFDLGTSKTISLKGQPGNIGGKNNHEEAVMVTSASKSERIIWISLLTVVIAVSTLFIVKYQTTLTLVNQRVSDFENEKKAWILSEADLTLQVSELKAQTEEQSKLIGTFPFNNPDVITGLKRQGFDGNVEDIKNDLLNHSELIPYDGVLGGKMGFHSKENVSVLSDKWVYADFDDGHINGSMLLSYNIKNRAISWKVIDSYLFE